MSSWSFNGRVKQAAVSGVGSTSSGETEAAWVMSLTWALADALMAAMSTHCERIALLERLLTLDLPVPDGSGSARYRSEHFSTLCHTFTTPC